ncbi:type IV pilus modification protein PilV, partial [Massilia arenosa]
MEGTKVRALRADVARAGAVSSGWPCGFSLVEVLVAMCVLAVGVLGAIATQAATLRTRHETRLASQAVVLAQGLADQMRANPAIFHGTDADNPYLQIDFDAGSAGQGGGAGSGSGSGAGAGAGGAANGAAVGACADAPCDPGAAAEADAAAVVQSVAAAFPGGRIVVCRDTILAAGQVPWACTPSAGAPVVIKIGWLARSTSSRTAPAAAAPRLVLAVPDVG